MIVMMKITVLWDMILCRMVCLPMLLRNVLPPSSGMKSEGCDKGGRKFLQNVCKHLPEYMVSYTRKQSCPNMSDDQTQNYPRTDEIV
jgi:hypothetical protein